MFDGRVIWVRKCVILYVIFCNCQSKTKIVFLNYPKYAEPRSKFQIHFWSWVTVRYSTYFLY